ncbi:MAG: UDP-N-acetylglucosamine 1-carboxyvinyltransferase [Leptospiraceae bacterium]|nr:UDP-N-acetylglucosamine 1-carboxyvinyltransferase [Leptospiraceae bacterium]
MQQFLIEGGYPLKGEITPQGNKNEALPVLCAALMNPSVVEIHNIPDIEDIRKLLKILDFIGARISPQDEKKIETLSLETPHILHNELPPELISALRGSVTLMGPLLARTGRVYLPRPGGDKIGRRRIDTHLLALSQLGAQVQVFPHGYLLEAKKLRGAEILLDEASVTGTENAICAAAVAEGTTVIENAASEPHVQGLCRFFQKQGVEIEGIGSNILKIKGVESWENLRPVKHTIGPDYLEIGSFISMAALTRGELKIRHVCPHDLRMIRHVFARLGISWDYEEVLGQTNLLIGPKQKLKIQTDVHGEIPKIDDAPWPMFPADLISIALVTATQCEGTVLIHEKMFESRLFFTDKLISMGARIVLCDPHRAVVIGPSKLQGAVMSSPDIRAGMAMVIAALCAEGKSTIQNIIQIDRGYERIDERLKKLGARIERVED